MKACQIVAGIFVALWLAALALLAIGTFGWFGQERDPLSGVFLVPLGLPWNMILPVPDKGALALGVLAPGMNLLCLLFVCRLLRGRR